MTRNMRSSHARVRDATSADLPRIVELLAQLSLDEQREAPGPPLPDTYHAAFAQIEADPNLRLFVVEAAGVVIGTATLAIVPNLSYRGRPYAILENIVVDEPHRGAGHGELLVRHAVDLARAAGCYKVSLTSNKARTEAHRFYKRLGFRASHEGFRIDF